MQPSLYSENLKNFRPLWNLKCVSKLLRLLKFQPFLQTTLYNVIYDNTHMVQILTPPVFVVWRLVVCKPFNSAHKKAPYKKKLS